MGSICNPISVEIPMRYWKPVLENSRRKGVDDLFLIYSPSAKKTEDFFARHFEGDTLNRSLFPGQR